MLLLDVNVLLALAWPTHVHHAAAQTWFAQHCHDGWATCQFTELAFARLSMQPAVVKVPILFGDVMDALAIRHAGRLATFDRRIPALLPAASPLQAAVALIPA